MTGTEQLTSTLKKLRLSGILETLDLRSRQATDDHLSHSQFLYRLLCDEVERRGAGAVGLHERVDGGGDALPRHGVAAHQRRGRHRSTGSRRRHRSPGSRRRRH